MSITAFLSGMGLRIWYLLAVSDEARVLDRHFWRGFQERNTWRLEGLRSSPFPAMLASLRYPGGKNGAGTLQRLIGLMPLHRNYFELFLGSGAVIRFKTPAIGENVGIDIDPGALALHGGPGLKRWGSCRRGDAFRILTSGPAILDPETLIYLDPPYIGSTRADQRIYRHDMPGERQHRELLALAVRCRCMVMISGYFSPLYVRMLKAPHWRMISFPAMSRGGLRRECVWMNFPTPAVYHDPLFAAVGFRARERIKRRSLRWQKRFASMPAAERQVVWAALQMALRSSSPEMAIAAALPLRGHRRI